MSNTNITELNGATSISLADKSVVLSGNDRDSRLYSFTQLLALMQSNLKFGFPALVMQYSAPSATGFAITMLAADSWLLMTPTNAFAAGTITLPATKNDQQRVLITSTLTVTALSILGAGASVSGAPTTLVPGGFFTMAYDAVTATWYRIA